MTPAHALRRALRRVGIEADRASPARQWRLRLPVLLAARGLDWVLDVGANDGGFATELFEAGYHGHVVSFEPLPDAWERLRARAAGTPRWTVAPRLALSDHDGEGVLSEAGNGVSSSLLTMTARHVEAAPASATVASHTVPLRRLDGLLGELDIGAALYLKIDVQGAEGLVLAGAQEALRGAVRGVQIEMSLVPLYAGQALAGDLDAMLRAAGFDLWDIVPGFRDPVTLRLLQYDGIYFRD